MLRRPQALQLPSPRKPVGHRAAQLGPAQPNSSVHSPAGQALATAPVTAAPLLVSGFQSTTAPIRMASPATPALLRQHLKRGIGFVHFKAAIAHRAAPARGAHCAAEREQVQSGGHAALHFAQGQRLVWFIALVIRAGQFEQHKTRENVMSQFYCDGVEEVSVSGGVVRIDLFSLTGKQGEAGKPPPRDFVARLILAPEAFVQTYNSLTRVVRQLEERGLIQRPTDAAAGAPAGKAGAAAPTATVKPPAGKGRGSPNF